MKLSPIKKRLHQRVLEKLKLKKAAVGSKEITYELNYCGKVIIATDLPKGRGDISVGLLNKIIKQELLLTRRDYYAVEGCTKRFSDYVDILKQQKLILSICPKE